MNNEIPVFFAIDNNYAPFLAVALSSAARNCSKERSFRITVLYRELDSGHIERLKKFERENFKIDFFTMCADTEVFDDREANRFRCDYILAIYFRLFIASMFPKYDKAIYLDSDIVVNGDLSLLFDTEIGDNFIGACYDASISHSPDLYRYTEEAIGVKKNEYINSGVLLMNLKKMREEKFEEHFLYLLSKYHFDSVAPDQDYINAICNGKIYYLSEKWNAMPNDACKPLVNPFIIHYNLFSKPWRYSGIQYEEYFWEYARNSGQLKEILKIKQGFSKVQEEEDRLCLTTLISRAKEISKSKITFKSALQKGEMIRI